MCWHCLVVLLLPVLHYLSLLWQAFPMHSVTKATPIQFINGRSHMKKQRCHKTSLSGYYTYFSYDLLLMPSGVDTHTHTQTFVDKTISHVRPSATRTWFKTKNRDHKKNTYRDLRELLSKHLNKLLNPYF